MTRIPQRMINGRTRIEPILSRVIPNGKRGRDGTPIRIGLHFGRVDLAETWLANHRSKLGRVLRERFQMRTNMVHLLTPVASAGAHRCQQGPLLAGRCSSFELKRLLGLVLNRFRRGVV